MSSRFDRRSRSLWMKVDVAPNARQLEGDRSADTVIVGSGIAGISTAYELAIEGQKVVVVDRGAVAGGITARTTAHLAPLCDDLTSAMIELRGEDLSRLFYESQAAGIDRIEEIRNKKDIGCGFRRLDGSLFQAPNTDSQLIDDELEAVRKIGAPVERLVGIDALAGCDNRHVLRYPRQATFHPLKYLRGIAASVGAKGGVFYAGTIVREIKEQNGSVLVKTDRGTITAKAAVVATNGPINDTFAIHTKMAPYRSYAMAFEIGRGALPDALYWDTLDPYHYIRLQTGDRGLDYVIVGGADHKSG